ncbi:ankyrin repeat-containing protein, partial [Reticulomyxa filosa]
NVTNQWFEAVSQGDHGRMLEMIKTGFSVDTVQISRDEDQNMRLTALMLSTALDFEEVTKLLLKYGANLNAKDAVCFCFLSFRFVVKKKKKILIERHGQQLGRTPLIHGCQKNSLKCIKILIQQESTLVDAGDKKKKTPLMYAAACGFDKVVSYLLEHNPKQINAQDCNGMTALMHAIMSDQRNDECIRFIMSYKPDYTLQNQALSCS